VFVAQLGLKSMRIENFSGSKPVSLIPEKMDRTAIGQAKREFRTVLGQIADMIVDASTANGKKIPFTLRVWRPKKRVAPRHHPLSMFHSRNLVLAGMAVGKGDVDRGYVNIVCR